MEIKVKVEVEMLPQLSIHTVEKTHAKAFVKRLTDGKRLQNWKAEPIPFVFFFKSNCSYLIMLVKMFYICFVLFAFLIMLAI